MALRPVAPVAAHPVGEVPVVVVVIVHGEGGQQPQRHGHYGLLRAPKCVEGVCVADSVMDQTQ